MTEQDRSEIQAEYKKETGDSVINTQGEFDIDYVDWLEQKLQASQQKDNMPTYKDLEREFKKYDVSGGRKMMYELSDHDLGDLFNWLESQN